MLYVIGDNYPRMSPEVLVMREKVMAAGKLVAGLIHSTESRKSKSLRLLTPIFHLLSPIFHIPCV